MNKGLVILVLAASLLVVSADPESFTKAFNALTFDNLDGWTMQGNMKANQFFSDCAGVRMVGGFGVAGVKATLVKVFKLPPHYRVTLRFQFWKIDSWDNEFFYLYADANLIYQKQYRYNDGTNLCGQGGDWGEVREQVEVAIDHTGNTIVVVMTSNLDENAENESWGMRDFELLIERCPENCDACRNSSKDDCLVWAVGAWNWTGDIGAEGWKVEGAPTAVTNCGGIPVLGGFGNFGANAKVTKTFDNLAAHFKLKVKMVFLKIDSWDNEHASLQLEGTEIWGQNFQYNQGYWVSLCGQPNDWRELAVNVDVDVAHKGSSASFLVTSNLNEDANNESWGVRDFFIYGQKCADKCEECTGPFPKDCTKCSGSFIFQDGTCQPMVNFVLLNQAFWDQQFVGVDGWTLTGNANGLATSLCAGTTVVGGFNVFGKGASASKTFNVPGHNRLRIQSQVYKIDSWDNEIFFVNLDNTNVFQRQIGFASGGVPLCGRAESNWNELIFNVDVIIAHTAPTALIQMTSNLDETPDNESWGFRQFRLYYEAKKPCAVFYSDCDFKGTSFEFCADSPNFRSDNVPPLIRSIKVPPQGRVTLYERNDYAGGRQVFTEDQKCLDGFTWTAPAAAPAPADKPAAASFLQLSGKIEYDEGTQWTQIEVSDDEFTLSGNTGKFLN